MAFKIINSLLFIFKYTQIPQIPYKKFYDHMVLVVVPTSYIQTIRFLKQFITNYCQFLEQYIIQFIQRVILDVRICLADEHQFDYFKKSPQFNFTEYHTQLPPTCIQDHQCRILQEYSRLYGHRGTLSSNASWNFNTPACHSNNQAQLSTMSVQKSSSCCQASAIDRGHYAAKPLAIRHVFRHASTQQ